MGSLPPLDGERNFPQSNKRLPAEFLADKDLPGVGLA